MKSNEIIKNKIDTVAEFKSDSCWTGYKRQGTKQKNGRTVPNCVPKESVEEGSLNEVTQGVEHSEWVDNVKDAYYPTQVRIVKKRTEDGRHVKSVAMIGDKLVGQYSMNTGVGTFKSAKQHSVAESGFFNPANPISPLNPTSPTSPMNPASPVYYGNATGTVSPADLKILMNVLTGLVTGMAALGAKVAADKFMSKAKSIVKGKLSVDEQELKKIQSQIKSIYRMLDKTKKPETKEKYQTMLKDAYRALEEIKSRAELKSRGTVAEVKKEYCDACDSVITKRPHVCSGSEKKDKLSEDYSKTLSENLRDWFGTGKEGGAGGGGWDRYNTKGERIGKCGDRKPGEGKPKCLSKSKAASLRASGGKKAIANAVKRKKSQDKNPERRGKAKNVKNVVESVGKDYDVAEIWASNFIADGQDMRTMFDIPDGSKISFGELPQSVQIEVERQIGGDIGDGEEVIIQQRGEGGLDSDRIIVLVPPLTDLDEETMAQASKNPTGPKFGGYYGATQRGSPRPGQSFGGAAESKTNKNKKITWNDLPKHLTTNERAGIFEHYILHGNSIENENELKYGFDVRSDVLWPVKMFEEYNTNANKFNNWINDYREQVVEPKKNKPCILAMINRMLDQILIIYGTATYMGQDQTSYLLKIDSGTHRYDKKNQIVFRSKIDFDKFLTELGLRFVDDSTNLKIKRDTVKETVEKLSEVAPPDQEDWIKKNKERFIKQYGKKKGTEVLYATAWKRSKTDEAANWGPHEGHVSKNPIGIPENQESDLEKKLERAKARMNAYTTKAPLRDKVKTRKEISDLKKQLGKKD